MREIKFRAWDQFGTFTDNGKPGWLQDITGLTIFDSVWRSDDFIKVQYTGLKDKNGKEIYEGDIVIVNSSHKALKANFEPDKSVVQWREKGACFDMLHADYLNAERKVGLTFDNGMVDTIEIIGNIYENPELVDGDV